MHFCEPEAYGRVCVLGLWCLEACGPVDRQVLLHQDRDNEPSSFSLFHISGQRFCPRKVQHELAQ